MSDFTSFQKVVSSLGMEKLEHPIFYNSFVGIRFNIGDDDNENLFNSHYVATCLERSLKIYHSLKHSPDLLVIEGYLYKSETIKDFISSVLSVADLSQPDEIMLDDFQDECTHLFLLWELKNFSPDKLLKEIILAESGNGNYFLTSSVYFVCTNDNVIFHLYDDRGADLVADKKERIQHIYNELNDLISDYDKEKIDSIFKMAE